MISDHDRDMAMIGRPLTVYGADKSSSARPASCAPSIEAAYAMGEKGGQVVEAERLAFEAWMRGHCWALTAAWDGATYRGTAEHGSYVCPHAMQVRQLWAAWRDRAALAYNAE